MDHEQQSTAFINNFVYKVWVQYLIQKKLNFLANTTFLLWNFHKMGLKLAADLGNLTLNHSGLNSDIPSSVQKSSQSTFSHYLNTY
jgi:hypothetical protein